MVQNLIQAEIGELLSISRLDKVSALESVLFWFLLF